jgi:hypothetical protein
MGMNNEHIFGSTLRGVWFGIVVQPCFLLEGHSNTGNDCFLVSNGTSRSPGSWTGNIAVCIFSNLILVHSCHWCENFVAPQCLWPHSCWVDTMSVPVFGSSVVLNLELVFTKTKSLLELWVRFWIFETRIPEPLVIVNIHLLKYGSFLGIRFLIF